MHEIGAGLSLVSLIQEMVRLRRKTSNLKIDYENRFSRHRSVKVVNTENDDT